MSGQLLYALQLRLKRNKVNSKRRKAEIVGLREEFKKEIQNYMLALYNSSSQIWEFLNLEPHSISQVNPIGKASILQKSPETNTLISSRDSLQKYVEGNMRDGRLPKESVLFVLSLFNFCWSEESSDAFINKLLSLPKEQQKVLSQCMVPNPLLHNYFVSALRVVFNNFEYLAIEELLKLALDSLKEYAPLMPQFLTKIIDQEHDLFCDCFLIPFVRHFSLFGIAHYEVTLFYPGKAEKLIDALKGFFGSGKAAEFFEDLTKVFPIYMAPHEKNIRQIDPKYVPQTLLTPESHNVSEPTFIPLATSIFIPSSLMSMHMPGFVTTVRKLLLDCELICLETEETCPNKLLSQLVSLTSYYGDPILESALDEVDEYASKHPDLSVQAICQMINNELDREEISQEENPLISIAQYSRQSSFIKRMTEVVNSVSTNAFSYLNFIHIQMEIGKFANEIASKSFIESFLLLKDKLECRNFQQLRNLHSIILNQMNYLEKQNFSFEDQKIHSYLEKNRDSLLAMHKQKFLEIYKADPSLLKLFFQEFELAFRTRLPISRMSHIHNSYTILIGLLKEQGIGDIGADQIVPLAMVATVLSNPIGLAQTKQLFSDILQPLINSASPLGSAEEYSLIQFLSTLQFLVEQNSM